MARDWPDGRGIWHNDAKTFLVWINEEDHTRLISMQKGGNIAQVFQRFCQGLNLVSWIFNWFEISVTLCFCGSAGYSSACSVECRRSELSCRPLASRHCCSPRCASTCLQLCTVIAALEHTYFVIHSQCSIELCVLWVYEYTTPIMNNKMRTASLVTGIIGCNCHRWDNSIHMIHGSIWVFQQSCYENVQVFVARQ